MAALAKADRVDRNWHNASATCDISTIFPSIQLRIVWDDTVSGTSRKTRSTSFKQYRSCIERCLLMATDPGDLVLDPTCGSGTTAYRRRAMGPPLDHD